MNGAGGIIAANHMNTIATKDGSVICMPLSTMPLNQVIAPEPVRYDANRVSWIGNLEKATGTILTWHTSQTKTMQDAMRRETPMAGTGKSATHAAPVIKSAQVKPGVLNANAKMGRHHHRHVRHHRHHRYHR